MTKLFEGLKTREVRPDPDEPTAPQPGALATGSFWSLFQRDDIFVVEYMSGEVAGITKEVTISSAEAKQLLSGDDDLAIRIINAHGGS